MSLNVHQRTSALVVLAAAASIALSPIAYADKVRFEIASGPARQTLNEFISQAGLQLLFDFEAVDGLTTHAVSGELEAKDALARMLAGTGLVFEFVNDRTIAVTKRSDKRRAQVETTSAAVERGRYRRLAQADRVHGASSAAADEIEEILVTGSRLRRREAQGPSQVIVMDRDRIERAGVSTVREILAFVPQTGYALDESGGGGNLGGSSNVRLRGLPSRATLILINGRRVGVSAISQTFFDLNSIPLSAVERVEILTDSASAIYGGDAIAGAVNFILKKDYEGAAADVRAGTSYEGDGTEIGATLTLGGASERFSGMMVLDHFRRDAVEYSARANTANSDFRDVGGTDRRIAYPATVWALPGQGNLPGLGSRFASTPTGQDGTSLTSADFLSTAGVQSRFEQSPYITLIPDTSRAGIMATGRYELSDATRLVAEVIASTNEQTRLATPGSLTGGSSGAFVVPAGNPFNPFGVAVAVDYAMVELGPRSQEFDTDSARALAGLEGAMTDSLSWELTYLMDESRGSIYEPNQVNTTAARAFLASTDPAVALNVFSDQGNNNAATLDAIRVNTQSRRQTSASMLEGIVRGTAFSLPSGPISIAAGFDVRQESAEQINGSTAGTTVFTADRDVSAGFLELELPIIAPESGVPLVHELRATAAVRHDDYSDFGSSTNPQFGLVWRPTSSLLLRASRGTAFRPPNFFELFLPQVSFIGSIADPARGGEVASYTLTSGGNPRLDPEEGESLSYGARWEPGFLDGFSIDVTAYRVEFTDAIQFLSPTLILAHPELFSERIARAAPIPGDPRPGPLLSLDGSNINFGSIDVEGADAQIAYQTLPYRRGVLSGSLSASYIDRYDVGLAPGVPPENVVGQSSFSGAPPRFRAAASLWWTGTSGLSAGFNTRYVGARTDFVDALAGQRELSEEWVVDVQGAYDFGESAPEALRNLKMSIGVINLTNEQGDRAANFIGYDVMQSDQRGRFWYLRLSKRL